MRRRDQDGWSVKEDAGRGWRRVVPSPEPIRIVEVDAIRSLIESRFVVISVGGGGIPVVADENGELTGIAAVIDKDHACSLLANEIEAELLLITTAVEKVALDFGQPTQRWLDRMTLAEAKEYLAEGTHFLPGSMAPEDRGGGRLPRARRRHRDHHRPGERRAGARRGDGHAHRPGLRRYGRTMTDLSRRLAVARGDEPADTVVRGGRVFCVFTREWLDADVAIVDGVIAGIGEYDGDRGDRRHRPLRRARASSTPTCTSSR